MSRVSVTCVYCDKMTEAIVSDGFRWKVAKSVNIFDICKDI